MWVVKSYVKLCWARMPTQKVKREIIVASPDTCEGGDTDSERALYGKAFLKRLERNKFSKQLI